MDAANDNGLPRTRAEAKLTGSKRYFTGEACKHGHVAARLTSNRCCVDCAYARAERWRNENGDHLNEYRKAVYAENKEEILSRWSEWYADNREEQLAKKAKRYSENKDANLEYAAQYRADNPDKVRAATVKWREENPEKVKEGRDRWYAGFGKERDARRRATPRGRIDDAMGNGVYLAVKEQKAGRRWEVLVGYTADDLIAHLTKLFQPGMTLDNYGLWHIDHKIPKAAFNYTSPEHIDFKRCWALENLQPLWALDNLKKHARLEKPFQPSLAING